MVKDNSEANAGERNDLGNFDGMLHTGLASHFRAGGSRYSKTKYDPLNAFLPGHLAAWILTSCATGFIRSTRSAITPRPAKALEFIRSQSKRR